RLGEQAVVERLDLGPGVEGDYVEQVDAPAVEAGAGLAGAVGDALHLLEVFLVVAAEEEGVGEGAGELPRLGGGLGAEGGGEAADVGCDLGGEEPAVLDAAVVGFALDVDDDPASL